MRSIPFRFAVYVLAPLLSASVAGAANSSPIQFDIQPLVGFEQVQKLIPTAHSKSRLMYGARVIAGIPLLSIEGEATRSTDSETFYSPSLTVKDSDDKIKVGLRSSYRITSLISIYARAGAQAKRNTHEETDSSGTTTKKIAPLSYDPYAGAGFSATLGGKFSFNSGIAVVFNDFPKMTSNEYQMTAGFSIHLP